MDSIMNVKRRNTILRISRLLENYLSKLFSSFSAHWASRRVTFLVHQKKKKGHLPNTIAVLTQKGTGKKNPVI